MRAALALSRRGLGTTWPNPSVGCVIVAGGLVVGRGVTAPGGRPHAEVLALAMAGPRARGATAYVTLEPCSHWGQTPPCADALVAAGVARVVAALGDPDPRVDGAGLARLRAAGVAVETGVLAAEAAALQAGFLGVRTLGRPMVTLKLASTLDGRIATRTGESRWITGPWARRAVHRMRGEHDAVLVGIGTALADDPDLTCRLPGFRERPVVRVVADGRLRLPVASRLVATAGAHPTWVLHRAGADPVLAAALAAAGVRLIELPGDAAGIKPVAAMRALAAAGLTRVFAEGGGRLASSLLRAGVVDRLAWFHAPAVMGADGWPAAQALGVAGLAGMPRFERLSVTPLGEDVLSEFRGTRGYAQGRAEGGV